MEDMTEVRVSEAVARPVRGAGQGSAAWLVTEAFEAFNIYDFTESQYGLSVLILSVLFTFIQTMIENKIGKGFLRQVPPTTAPVTSIGETHSCSEDHPDNQESTETPPVADLDGDGIPDDLETEDEDLSDIDPHVQPVLNDSKEA